MDPHFPFASREDLWRLQNDMKTVYSTQAEYADRILRLERRQDEDARMKSVWGGSSLPSAMSNTSQPGMIGTKRMHDWRALTNIN